MASVGPLSRLKVKADTFYLPNSDGAVYFRSNTGWLRMEGRGIDEWIEKLVPVFTGEHTLAELTDGLPEPYVRRIYEIADVLYQNGFVRDLQGDLPHGLSAALQRCYASQIEFLDNTVGSGGYHFERYRERPVVAVGYGSFLNALVSALLTSGVAKVGVMVTHPAQTNRDRLRELVEHAQRDDPDLTMALLEPAGTHSWLAAISGYDAVFYVSETVDLADLQRVEQYCREQEKVFLPALFHRGIGIAGPLLAPTTSLRWASVWRRLHATCLDANVEHSRISPTTRALLANVMVFEWLKYVAGVADSAKETQIYLLNQETLEGTWHPIRPHPLVSGEVHVTEVSDVDHRLKHDHADLTDNDPLMVRFQELTSPFTGILHEWAEGALSQLPLAQCKVQPVDPLSPGPAQLLQEEICNGLTHEEARREAGLYGVEVYAGRTLEGFNFSESELDIRPDAYMGVGTGATWAEAVYRGLHKCLTNTLARTMTGTTEPEPLRQLQLTEVADHPVRFYLEALTALNGLPAFGWGPEIHGFPGLWVRSAGMWYGAPSIHPGLALRRVLQQALSRAQNGRTVPQNAFVVETDALCCAEGNPVRQAIPDGSTLDWSDLVRSALKTLKRAGTAVRVLELAVEPAFQSPLAGVVGVVLREEGRQWTPFWLLGKGNSRN
ncbi:putative thiazole-containing bacteriocin maturation protein [Alicyclobacillus herbarius]|uniref:putative thiazole-containing bacteriocin maturation protein n=1 Tax=Alicyclobacillus herbarius TaxID=122960 RepID=UPI0004086495|nr:putative thiazole-containing bacteriocin maturation protein [Alicyclobacillus herbarius]